MLSSVIIENENKRRGWSEAEAAELAQIDIEDFREILLGKKEPNYEQAVRLSDVYQVPIALFTSSGRQPIYINTGSGTYNNSINCYIGTYAGDASLKDLFKELLAVVKPDKESDETLKDENREKEN